MDFDLLNLLPGWLKSTVVTVLAAQYLFQGLAVLGFRVAKSCGEIEADWARKVGKSSWTAACVCNTMSGNRSERYFEAKYAPRKRPDKDESQPA